MKSRKNLLFLQSYKEDSVIEEEDIVNAIPKTLQDNIFWFNFSLFMTKKDGPGARFGLEDLTWQWMKMKSKLIAVMLRINFRTF